jgi:hypothetical protein
VPSRVKCEETGSELREVGSCRRRRFIVSKLMATLVQLGW